MNIDDLKKPIPALDYDDSPYLSGLNEGQAIGWNEAIDYLASRGYLATQQPADAVEALGKAREIFENWITDNGDYPHLKHKSFGGNYLHEEVSMKWDGFKTGYLAKE